MKIGDAPTARGEFVPSIHPTAQIAGAVAADVVIGPFCVVGPEVVLSSGVRLHENVIVVGDTEIGERTEIFPFASIGKPGRSRATPAFLVSSRSVPVAYCENTSPSMWDRKRVTLLPKSAVIATL